MKEPVAAVTLKAHSTSYITDCPSWAWTFVWTLNQHEARSAAQCCTWQHISKHFLHHLASTVEYDAVLAEFPSVTKPCQQLRPSLQPVKHNNSPHQSTPYGTSDSCLSLPSTTWTSPRCPESYAGRRDHTTIQWSMDITPLHGPKEDTCMETVWRPRHGNFRALNHVSVSGHYPIPHMQSFTVTLHGQYYISSPSLTWH